jgi:hypothetical protein
MKIYVPERKNAHKPAGTAGEAAELTSGREVKL